MRTHMIGLAAIFVFAGIGSGVASTGPDAVRPDASAVTTAKLLGQTSSDDGSIVVARRGRGADDKGKDHHGGNKDGKHKGGHDDGPNHDKNDDHGKHDRNHA
jgi:hypothetical protein